MPEIFSYCAECDARLRFNVQRTTGVVRAKCPKCGALTPVQIEESLFEEQLGVLEETQQNRSKQRSQYRSAQPVGGVVDPIILSPQPECQSARSQGGWDIPAPTFKPKEYEFDPRWITYPLIGLVLFGIVVGGIIGLVHVSRALNVSPSLIAMFGGNPAINLMERARDLDREVDFELDSFPAGQRDSQGSSVLAARMPQLQSMFEESIKLPAFNWRIDAANSQLEAAQKNFMEDGNVDKLEAILGDVADTETKVGRFQSFLGFEQKSGFQKELSDYIELYSLTIGICKGCRMLEDPIDYSGTLAKPSETELRWMASDSLASRFFRKIALEVFAMTEASDFSDTRFDRLGSMIDSVLGDCNRSLGTVASAASSGSSNARAPGGWIATRYSRQNNHWYSLCQSSISLMDRKLREESITTRSADTAYLRSEISSIAFAFGKAKENQLSELNKFTNTTFLSRRSSAMQGQAGTNPSEFKPESILELTGPN